MPKFHVSGSRTTLQRVTFEVEAKSAEGARQAVQMSEDPNVEFEEIGDFDEGQYDVSVTSVRRQD